MRTYKFENPEAAAQARQKGLKQRKAKQTERRERVRKLLEEGNNKSEIARMLDVSVKTIRLDVQAIETKD